MNLNEAGIEAMSTLREHNNDLGDPAVGLTSVKNLHINRPFLFSIQDRKSKIILYLGQVMSPVSN